MPRAAKAALGSYTTPHGTAHFRARATGNGEQTALHARGSALTLRWLFPKRSIKDHQQQVDIVPPDPHATADGVTALFAEMVKSWNLRLAQTPGAWSPRSAPLGATTGVIPSLSDLVRQLETHATATVRSSTLTTYKYSWQIVLRTIPPTTPITALTPAMLLASITTVQSEGMSAESVRRHVAALKRLCGFAIEHGLLAQDPSKTIKLPKVPKRMPRYLSPEERDRLLAVAAAKGRDYHLLVATGVYLGLRKAEMNALQWTDINIDRKTAQIVNTEDFTTKSGTYRAVPICDEMMAIFTRYRQAAGFVMAPKKRYRDKARYRWEFREGFKDMVIEAKLDVRVITPHALRHTFASTLAQRGVSLYKIAAWMGHSTASVTELYAHLTAYDDDIRRLNRPAAEELATAKPAVNTPA